MKVGYARVSTAEQADTDALEQQINRLKAAGAEHIYVDVQSGRKDTRKSFNKLLKEVERDLVKEVIITRIDRLGRSVITLERTLKLFNDKNVKLWILDSPIDLSSPFGKFSYSQMSALAEFESMLLGMRVRSGMKYFRQQEKIYKVPYGYKKNSETQKLEPNLDIHEPSGLTYWDIAKESIEIFFRLKVLRQATIEIYKRFGVKWSNSGLKEWMINPLLRGHTVYFRWHNKNNPEKWEISYNTHRALITEQQYQDIEKLIFLSRQKRGCNKKNEAAASYPLAGQIKCGECGKNCFRIFVPTTKEPRMKCVTHNFSKYLCSSKKSTPFHLIETTVVAKLKERAKIIADKMLVDNEEVKGDTAEIAELKQQLEGLRKLGNNPALLAAQEQILAQITNLEAARSNQSRLKNDIKQYIVQVFSMGDSWLDLSDSDRKMGYLEYVDKVIIFNGEIIDIILKI